MQINEELINQVTETTSKEVLTGLLYTGCINFINAGIDALNKKDYESTNTYLQHAQKIINEFRTTLNYDYDISKQLDMLYAYSYEQLVKGNIKNDLTALNNAKFVINELSDTWNQIISKAV